MPADYHSVDAGIGRRRVDGRPATHELLGESVMTLGRKLAAGWLPTLGEDRGERARARADAGALPPCSAWIASQA